MIKISEIIASLQGEGKNTGLPTTFVRLYGCNLRCPFCDAKYTFDGTRPSLNMGLEDIVDVVKERKNPYVCITGGEPLMQKEVYEVIEELTELGYKVSIETNGAIVIPESKVGNGYIFCMDIKCPSSLMSRYNKYQNLANLSEDDEVKFVIWDRGDYEFAKEVLVTYPTRANVIMSPCFNEDLTHNGGELAEWLMEDKIEARLGLQIHKLLNIY